ncbi:MAG: YolD-like family protein [Eggerthellaceae bacterium]|nr:YolD-like family protein [Eggerthellaceae bacterium]
MHNTRLSDEDNARAAQFVPFAALRGYYDLIREQEQVAQPRHELTTEESATLSSTLCKIRPRMIVKVTYYDNDSYRTVQGIVTEINSAVRCIEIIKTEISFDDISALTILSIS